MASLDATTAGIKYIERIPYARERPLKTQPRRVAVSINF